MSRLMASELYRILVSMMYVNAFSVSELSSVTGVRPDVVRAVLGLVQERGILSIGSDGRYQVVEGADVEILDRVLDIAKRRIRLRSWRRSKQTGALGFSRSRFATAMLMARRAEQLLRGARPGIKGMSGKATTLAIAEVANGIVTYSNLDEFDKFSVVEREESREVMFDFEEEADAMRGDWPGIIGWRIAE